MPTLPPPAISVAISRAAASGADDRLGLVVGAGGGGKQQREVGDRLLDRVEQFGLVEDMVGAGRRRGGHARSASRRAD